MLVLTRRIGETIVIDGGIRVTVAEIKGDKVRIGIEAPPSIRIDRQEVHKRRLDGEGLASSASRGRRTAGPGPKPLLVNG
jgi:carbon storage regulator